MQPTDGTTRTVRDSVTAPATTTGVTEGRAAERAVTDRLASHFVAAAPAREVRGEAKSDAATESVPSQAGAGYTRNNPLKRPIAPQGRGGNFPKRRTGHPSRAAAHASEASQTNPSTLDMDHNTIAAELLCSICKKLPVDPVAYRGSIYERSEIESKIGRQENGAAVEVYPLGQVKRVFELLVRIGNLDEEYLGKVTESKPNEEQCVDCSKERACENNGNNMGIAVENTYEDNEDTDICDISSLRCNQVPCLPQLVEPISTVYESESGSNVEGGPSHTATNDTPAEPSIGCRNESGVVDEDALAVNNDKHLSLLETEAEAGDADSMVKLGELCLKGSCIQKDEQTAYYWFDQASEKENVLGIARKADCLLTGLGVQQNTEEGLRILVQAASEDKSAHAALRVWYFHSERLQCIGQDSMEAEKWLRRLKKLSCELSDGDLHKMKEQLIGLIGSPSAEREEVVREHANKDQITHPEIDAEMEHKPTKTSAKENSTATEKLCRVISRSNRHSTSNEANAEEKQDILVAPATGPVKECHSCHLSRPKSAFSLSQWKKPQRTGSCMDCCVKGDETKKKSCSLCNTLKEIDTFTQSQWTLSAGTRTCIECCKKEADEEDPIVSKEDKDVGTAEKSNQQPIKSPIHSENKTGIVVEDQLDEEENLRSSHHDQVLSLEEFVERVLTSDDGIPVLKIDHSKDEENPTPVEEDEAVFPSDKTRQKCSFSCVGTENKACIPDSGTYNKVSTADGSAPVKKNSQPAPAVSIGAPHVHVKPCFECGKPQPQTDFTASQWKKRVGTGRCYTCVSKSPQWKTGIVASSLQTKLCSECNASKSHTDFSPNQWRRKTGTGRCKYCVKKSLP